MITLDKITDIFCTLDEFSKNFDAEVAKGELMYIVEKLGLWQPAFPVLSCRACMGLRYSYNQLADFIEKQRIFYETDRVMYSSKL